MKFLLILLSINMAYASELSVLGKGRLTWFGFKVYDAKLFGEIQKATLDQKLRLELTYLRSLDGEDIFDQTLKEWKGMGLSKKRINSIIPLIKKKFPDVKENDKIRAEFDPKSGLKVYYNNSKVIIENSDISFAKDFMGIWLSPKTSEKKLRKKLFGVYK